MVRYGGTYSVTNVINVKTFINHMLFKGPFIEEESLLKYPTITRLFEYPHADRGFHFPNLLISQSNVDGFCFNMGHLKAGIKGS